MKKWICFLILPLTMVIGLWGCPKKVPPTSQSIEVTEKPAAPAPSERPQREQPPVVTEQPIVQDKGPTALKDVYFDFDRSDIRPDARKVLEENAKWFKANPQVKVMIEGHCDERGTTEYNLALGQRRAESTKRVLVAMGVDPSRISTISYGEEKPVCTDHSEGCWSKNRRAHFSRQSR